MMAVFAVEETPAERGRMQTLSLLHAASDALRSILLDSVDEMDKSTKNVCIELFCNAALQLQQTHIIHPHLHHQQALECQQMHIGLG